MYETAVYSFFTSWSFPLVVLVSLAWPLFYLPMCKLFGSKE